MILLGADKLLGKFIPNSATILHPLNNLLCKEAKCVEVVGGVPEGFDLAREKLTSAKVLTHYTPILPIR